LEKEESVDRRGNDHGVWRKTRISQRDLMRDLQREVANISVYQSRKECGRREVGGNTEKGGKGRGRRWINSLTNMGPSKGEKNGEQGVVHRGEKWYRK